MESETKLETPTKNEFNSNKNKLSLPMAIIVAGILIAGAIYFSSSAPKNIPTNDNEIGIATLAPVNKEDKKLGNPDAKVVLVIYGDFQCPFCGAITGLLGPDTSAIKYLKKADPNWTPFMPEIINNYVKNGNILFVYRDWAFQGPESIKAAEAARCAGDQNKFWEYHDYLYAHQNGENQGNFSDSNLKSFAKNLGLNTATFNQCLDGNKYTQTVADSRDEGTRAGVQGTPKGFILKNGKIVSTIDGAESLTTVKQKIEAALK